MSKHSTFSSQDRGRLPSVHAIKKREHFITRIFLASNLFFITVLN